MVTHGSYMVDEVVSLYSFTALQYKHYLTLNLHFFNSVKPGIAIKVDAIHFITAIVTRHSQRLRL